MAALTNYAENALANHVYRNTPLTSPAAIYVGLFTAAPGEATAGTEVTGGGYARQQVTFGAPSDGVVANTGAVTFTRTGAPVTVVAAGYFDAATGGNLIAYMTTTSASLGDGEQIQFAVGALTASFA